MPLLFPVLPLVLCRHAHALPKRIVDFCLWKCLTCCVACHMEVVACHLLWGLLNKSYIANSLFCQQVAKLPYKKVLVKMILYFLSTFCCTIIPCNCNYTQVCLWIFRAPWFAANQAAVRSEFSCNAALTTYIPRILKLKPLPSFMFVELIKQE